jgi:hypothetical protein
MDSERVQDKNLHDAGRAALLRRPRIQGGAAALPCQEDEDFCHAPIQSRASVLTIDTNIIIDGMGVPTGRASIRH